MNNLKKDIILKEFEDFVLLPSIGCIGNIKKSLYARMNKIEAKQVA